ncbi:DEAD/DEAH box helicase family protein [Bacteroides ovatus]|uniref:DEAD/DEAH box helicase family protein n=1 Tax=Bacteroides ovatus TaxID=28116 RepID=UPI00189A48D2|nr:DEAD/DEAH box helicase family protein [Bacteroides ovatus]MDC2674286.1 DEAD/DEAH box helicase family protein [Bacteroides ovatus]MDC2694599.1 DEAD/DEAH box helicase family protein [Bacteroides ovatus]MDC2699536.1 DEAD/DEAH box helicase family protein [Bacteroides ovatus]MDC2714677.1 DEAD/DEAH box helicase family protein [Bacteroides ovatus]
MTTTKQIQVSKNELDKVQYLTEVLPEIPTNTILYKKLTGLGATYGEITAKRNSIIIEPNVPVIIGKCNDPKHKDDNLFGVYEGVYTDDIVNYLEKSKKKYYKILTTPESFQKVKDAFEELEMSAHCSCFLLFDECHKLVKDADYRNNITLPIDDFFKFDQKALVSATPIELNDPQFKEQNFKMIEIQPTFDYKKELWLHHTNNTLQALKTVLSKLDNEEAAPLPICVFINSTDIIYSLMKQLDLLEDSAVFCAPKSVDKLKKNRFCNVYEEWNKDKMKRYNFFTSRFFNAVDMELEEQPHVIMLTDVYFAEHTMIDPYTDAIQIVGRFRNGVSSITYISNTKKGLPQRSKEEIKGYLICSKEIYRTMKNFYDCATDRASRDAYRAALESLPFNRMLDRNGRENWFAIDNYMDEELMKNYFYDENSLYKAYDNCDSFIVYHAGYYCPLGDSERLKRENKSQSIKDKRKEIVRQLEMLGDCVTEMELEYKRDLIAADSFIVEAYDTVGKEVIEKLKYSKKKITEAMIQKQYSEKATGTEVIRLIKNSFTVGQKYTCKHIKEEITRIYALLNIHPPKTITSKTINDFFVVSECKVNKDRGYLFISESI